MLKKISVAFMACSVVARIIYFYVLHKGGTNLGAVDAVFLLCMPLAAAVVFIAASFIKCDATSFRISAVAVVLGCIFFAYKSLSFGALHRLFCLLLYTLVAVLYILTATGVVRNKLILCFVFGAALATHIVMDIQEFFAVYNCSWDVSYWQEGSVLFIMASLLTASVSRFIHRA